MELRTIVGVVLALVVGLAIGFIVSPAIHPPVSATVTATVTVRERETVTILTTAREVVTASVARTVTEYITLPITTYTTVRETAIVQQTVVKEWPRVIVDALGRKVEFEEPPKRVVSTIPSITEHLFVLGLGDRVVGVDSYSNWPPELLDLVNKGRIAVVGGPWTLDVEKIISLNPDLVLMCRGVRPQETQVAPKLEKVGIKTFFLICDAARNQYDIYTDIRTLGMIFDVEDRAEEVVNSIQQKINEIVSKLAGVDRKPRVLRLVGPPSWGLYSTGGDTFIHWLITTAGGINIASQYSGWPRLSYEYILAQDPEVIIVAVHDVDPKAVIEEMAQTPLVNTTAWRNNRVYVLVGEADDMSSRPGPRIAEALTMFAQIIHPEIFGETQREDIVKISFESIQIAMDLSFVVKTVTAVAEV